MVLTDTDILKAIEAGSITISGFDRSRLGSNSYDLRLSQHLGVYENTVLDARTEQTLERLTITEHGFKLEPGILYLGSTLESTRTMKHMPFIEGKSSVGRLGISIHATAGVGDIGFSGYWTLEISVIQPVIVYPGMPIAQVLFLMPLGVCARPYSLKADAKYHNQSHLPMPSMMHKNFNPHLYDKSKIPINE